MLENLILFCLLIVSQNVQTQLIQNGCNCHKLSNVALNQLLNNNLLTPRSVNNVQSLELQSSIGLPPQNGQPTSNMLLNGLNIMAGGNDFLFPNYLASNKSPKAANVLRTNNNLANQLAINPFFNELLSHTISSSACNAPTIKSSINNKLLNNGVQYNVGIQIDKKDLMNRIINSGAIKGNTEMLKMIQGTIPILNGMHLDTNDCNNIKMFNAPVNVDKQFTNVNMQPDYNLLALQGTLDRNGIHYMENIGLHSDVPIANTMFINLQQNIDKIPVIENSIPFANPTYIQNEGLLMNDNIGIDLPMPITRGIQLANEQFNINIPNMNAMTYDVSENLINNALLNNIVGTNSNPLLNSLFVTDPTTPSTMPVNNNRFDNIANLQHNYVNLYNPNLNIPDNILLNANEFISNNQFPLNNINNLVPNYELNMPNTGMQYTQDLKNLNGLVHNNFINTNTPEFTQVPIITMPQVKQINNMASENLYGDEALINFPVTLAQLEETLGNIHLSMPAKLEDWNTLNLGQYGCLPIINGLPVAGITETITVINPNI